MMTLKFGLLPVALGALLIPPASAARVPVSDSAALARAARQAKPGDEILLAPGRYAPDVHLSNLRGAAGKPILLRAADPSRRPRFEGGGVGIQLSDAAHVELRDLILTGAKNNGLNIDDGGSYATPAHHITLRNLLVQNVGPAGNSDGIKLSGVTDFRVLHCTIEDWGSGGSGVDMVGCRRGLIQGSAFYRGGGNGVQMKGGTSNVTVRGCRFRDAGSRAIQIGGSTGMAYFRPRPQGYEAKDILVEGNTVAGSDASVAFVGVDGAVVRRNTFYRPRRWAIRILQETVAPGFVPSRNGRFLENIVVWRGSEVGSVVNVGPHTAPETFRFARNLWYSMDAPSRSRPNLPAPEQGGTVGVDPLLRNPEGGDFRLKPGSPARGKGAHPA